MTIVLLPDTLDGEPTLPSDVEAVRYSVADPLPPRAEEAEVLVVWGNPRANLADAASRLPKLRWVQSLAAGTDDVLAAGFAPDVVVTSGRGLHDLPVAEHTLTLALALLRHVPDLVRAQQEHRWAAELGGRQPLHPVGAVRTLLDARVTIWGFGSIAAHLAPVLASLGARVTGIATAAGVRHGFPVLTEHAVAQVLPSTDLLIGLLPATDSTRHAIGAEALALLPPHALLVNVGRGATLDETALLAAVRAGALAGAALDVFEIEPLPADSPLWGEPRVLISPHAAGGRPVGAAELVADNLVRFVSGSPLRNVVHR